MWVYSCSEISGIAISDYLNQWHRSIYVSWEQNHLDLWNISAQLLFWVSGWFSSHFLCYPWLREDHLIGSVEGGYVEKHCVTLSSLFFFYWGFLKHYLKYFFFWWGFADFFVILFMQHFLNLLFLRAFFRSVYFACWYISVEVLI